MIACPIHVLPVRGCPCPNPVDTYRSAVETVEVTPIAGDPAELVGLLRDYAAAQHACDNCAGIDPATCLFNKED